MVYGSKFCYSEQKKNTLSKKIKSVSPGDHPLTKMLEDSGYDIG